MKLTFILYSAQTISKEKAFLALVKYNSSLFAASLLSNKNNRNM